MQVNKIYNRNCSGRRVLSRRKLITIEYEKNNRSMIDQFFMT